MATWTEETPISVTNLNDLEDRIATADAAVVAGKAAVAAAITAMGQAADGSETYAQLAGHIADISDDATAAVGDVLNTKTFYQGGNKKTGTMPNRGSVGTQNLTTEGQEYTIAAGYHNGLGKVKAVITNLIASVLKHGAVVGGITGNYDTEASVPITAATVLTGKKGRVNGATITGTMPDRAGDTAALSQTRSGTTIKLRASDGFRDGTNDYVTHADANDVAANIKAGVPIRGLTGTFTSDANAAASDIVLNKTAYVNGAKLTGSHSAIQSIQTGEIDTPYTDLSTDVTISSVDITKTIVIVNKPGVNSANHEWGLGYGYLIDATTLRIYGKGIAYYQVIQFNSDAVKSLNRGVADFISNMGDGYYGVNITIPAVNMAKTIVFCQNFDNGSETYVAAYINAEASLTSSTNLRVRRVGYAWEAYYYVVEFN